MDMSGLVQSIAMSGTSNNKRCRFKVNYQAKVAES